MIFAKLLALVAVILLCTAGYRNAQQGHKYDAIIQFTLAGIIFIVGVL